MIKFLFHRESKVVLVLEIAGLLGFIAIFWKLLVEPFSLLKTILVIATISGYLFVRFCSLWRWYSYGDRRTGVRLHFTKALVPTSYIIAISGWLFAGTNNIAILIMTIILLAIIIHVNIILIFLHLKDRDPAQVNSYTALKRIPFPREGNLLIYSCKGLDNHNIT